MQKFDKGALVRGVACEIFAPLRSHAYENENLIS